MKRTNTLTDHDAPLSQVISTLNARERESRRAVMRAFWGAGLLATPMASYAACSVIPSETAGPFPGDGTNGPDALAQSGIVRIDMRASFGTSGTTVAAGAPLALRLQLVNTDNNCASLAGYFVYAWHCDGAGEYSLYGGAASQNYLRAVQAADASGLVTFSTIVPGAYPGRWPHVHFEIFKLGAADSLNGRNALKTSQLALPAAMCGQAYSALPSAYKSSAATLAGLSLERDGVFADGAALQMAAATGNATTGYTASLTIGIAAGAGVGTQTKRAAAIEFYNTTLDHYVIVSDANEAAMIDAGGAGPGWQRTGQSFALDEPPATSGINVYRFYGSINPGPNSHFYTVSEEEKAALIQLANSTPANQKRWNYEGVGFRAGPASNEVCPQSLVAPAYSLPVYRLYNKGFPAKDSNHRYATSTAVVQDMVAKGWALEGVAFCALAS
jgi:protocatechuate 3,4-dioxygenase beta subunit